MEKGKAKTENGERQSLPPDPGRMRDFRDLETWQVARRLRAELYRIVRMFPREETYGLVAQIRRAAISVTANLAEGYGRYSFQENLQFCRQSRGSVYELRDHLTTALDAGYISQETYAQLESLAISVIRLLNGYIRSTKNLKSMSNKT